MVLTREHIEKNDPSGMRELIAGFPAQVEEALAIGKKFRGAGGNRSIRSVVVTGLGGSAIGGDLLRAYLAGTIRIPVVVNRNYFLPRSVGRNSLVIVSSYSGNTEETVSSYKDAIRKKAKILCITSGGEIGRMAQGNGDLLIPIPGGLPPRAALGYSFFPMLIALTKLGFVPSRHKEINETVSVLKEKMKIYSDFVSPENRAVRIAEALSGRLPVIYSSAERFDAVNLRWRGQISENAKMLAYGNVFPEMNHNEIVGWEVLKDLMKKMHVVVLRDKNDFVRTKLRMDITEGLLRDFADGITEVHSEGEALLARIFSLLYLGDWVSFYLAMLNSVDPSPVKKIDFLKNELGKMK